MAADRFVDVIAGEDAWPLYLRPLPEDEDCEVWPDVPAIVVSTLIPDDELNAVIAFAVKDARQALAARRRSA